MTIIYSLVSRDTNVLSEHTLKGITGNFSVITRALLEQLDGKKQVSYTHKKYVFHCITNDELTYLCMTEKDFPVDLAFKFLKSINQVFVDTYGNQGKTARAFQFNADFHRVLERNMKTFNSKPKIGQVQDVIATAQSNMKDTLSTALNLSGKMEILVESTEELENDALEFADEAYRLRRAKQCQKIKMNILITFVILFILYLGLSFICGFDFGQC